MMTFKDLKFSGAAATLGTLVLGSLLSYGGRAAADDSATAVTPSATPPEAVQNNRAATQEGSKSAWSGQLNFTYYGSTLAHPLSDAAPNPTNDPEQPLVHLNGTMAIRYRIDGQTTLGLGTGLTTETPIQGQQHTTLADPYVDLARKSTFGQIHNFAVIALNQYTNHQSYTAEGYRQGLTLQDEAAYETAFGLTAGLFGEIDANTFGSGTYPEGPKSQISYDVVAGPYAEYVLNKTFNLRTVLGKKWAHTENLSDGRRFKNTEPYQTFGLGIAASKACFVYAFVKAIPYSGVEMTRYNTTAGLSTIINLF